MKVDKYRHEYIQALNNQTDDIEKISFALEIFQEMIDESQSKAKSLTQDLRLQDLWILVEGAKKGYQSIKEKRS